MKKKKVGARDPENIDWIRNNKSIDKNNLTAAATFTAELQRKLDSFSEAQQNDYTNGSNYKEKWVATAMSYLATYYNCNFSLTEFGLLLGVMENNHNVKLVIKKLIQLKIMKDFHNRQGSIVYSLVDTLCIHIRYDEDDSLQKDLDSSFREGIDIIKERGRKRKKTNETSNDSKDTDKGSSASDDEEDDNNLNREEIYYKQFFK